MLTIKKTGAIMKSRKVKESQSQITTKFDRKDKTMKISDGIEKFIIDLLNSQSGEAEIGRNELAQSFGCVPSQINYVIQTRFTTERGYIVESRRGGGGFVRISRIEVPGDNYFMHIINSVGDDLDSETAKAIALNIYENGKITNKECKIILSAVSNKSIPLKKPVCDKLRALIFKNILANL